MSEVASIFDVVTSLYEALQFTGVLVLSVYFPLNFKHTAVLQACTTQLATLADTQMESMD